MRELYLRLTGGLSVSELIRSRPKNSSNVDEPEMRLGAETWRNMVGGGTVSGLWSMLQKWNFEVLLLLLLLLSRFCRPTLYDPIDGSPPGSPVSGICQARVLDWGAIAFSS